MLNTLIFKTMGGTQDLITKDFVFLQFPLGKQNYQQLPVSTW